MSRRAPICKRCHKRPATGPDRERDLVWRRTICDECRRGYMIADVLGVMEHALKVKRGEA